METERMKIAIINKYQNKVNRGAETFVRELAKRLSKNHEVDVLTSISLRKKYDVVIPTNGRLQATIVRIITWLTGSKMIVSGQSGIGLDDRINLLSFPNVFVALTKHAEDWAKRVNPFIKVVTIPNGVDLTIFKSKTVNSESKTKTVLAVGAFTKQKGHHLTIKAVSKIPDVKLTIVGDGGDYKDEITKLGGELLGDRLKIMSLPHNQMPDVYASADVFVYPTVAWESFGIAMVEAMATNIPVVAGSDPIRAEIVGDAGILIDPNNIDEYSSAIKTALTTDWKDKPRKQAMKFDWDEISTKYEDLLSGLI